MHPGFAGLSLLPVTRRARCVYIGVMNLDTLVLNIDAEISRLEKVRALLTDHTAPLKRETPTRKRNTMSAEGRARIAAAQRARWAAKKK
jgi:hypothetical protein